MHLLSHPGSSQWLNDLQKEIKETFPNKLPNISGMDIMEKFYRYNSFIETYALF